MRQAAQKQHVHTIKQKAAERARQADSHRSNSHDHATLVGLGRLSINNMHVVRNNDALSVRSTTSWERSMAWEDGCLLAQ